MISVVEYFGREWFDPIFFAFILAMVLVNMYMDFTDKRFPPGPFGVPIFGYLPKLNLRTPYITLKDLAMHYGKVFSVNLGSVYTVVISDVKLIREALNLNTFHNKVPFILAGDVTNGKGILMAENERWKHHRCFLHSTLQTMGSTKMFESGKVVLENKIQTSLSEFIQELTESRGTAKDIRSALRHAIGSLMFDVVTGIRPRKSDPKWQKMQTTVADQLKMMSITTSYNFVPFLRKFSQFTKTLKTMVSGRNEAKRLYKTCEEKYQNNESKVFHSIAEAYVTEVKGRQGKDDSCSVDQISHVLVDTLSMGWETTMNSIHWLFVYLSRYPDVQETIVREIEYVLGSLRGPLSLDDCKKLKYTETVLMEVWRIRPVLPMGLPHCTNEKTKLGNYWIREGTLVVPLIYAVHRDPRHWDKPDDFIPERHLNDDGNIIESDYYIPFQTGLRMCVGEDLAKWAVLLFLVGVVNNFKISFPTGVKYSQDDLPDFCVTSAPPSYKFILEARN